MTAAPAGEVTNRAVFSVVPFARILAGQRHAPVVYFAQMTHGVKIGTTTKLQSRMHDLYVPMSSVLALVPGGREVEAAYHRLFDEYKFNYRMRELFRVEGRLKRFLESQTEGSEASLSPCVPLLVQSAAARNAQVSGDVLGAANSGGEASAGLVTAEMGLSDIVAAGLVQGTLKALRMDRHRSDIGELPDGLKFPEPVRLEGQKEIFSVAEVQAFDVARRSKTPF